MPEPHVSVPLLDMSLVNDSIAHRAFEQKLLGSAMIMELVSWYILSDMIISCHANVLLSFVWIGFNLIGAVS
jgi:hypothetical protein